MVESTSDQSSAEELRFPVKISADSHMAWIRTRFAAERTMMAWIRTSVSLIGFGFTIVQFFERFSDFAQVADAARPWAPRYLGLALIGVGILTLTVSTWQYYSFLKYMWGKELGQLAGIDSNGKPHQTPIFTIALALLMVGLFAFVTIVFRAL